MGGYCIGWALCAVGFLGAASGHCQEWIYAVRPGDSLWELSRRHLSQVGRWVDLQKLNSIQDPQHIPPGTLIRVPIAWLKHQPVPAQVIAVSGTVEVASAPDRPSQPLEVGAELRVGARIQAGHNGSATIQFADQSLLLIQADSTVVLDTLSAFGKTGMVDTRVRLQRGRAESQVVPAKGPASRYQVITPAAVTAVRGTRFRVAAAAIDGATRAEVTMGRLEVEGAGVRRLVPSGFGIIAEVGKPPSEPTKLLSPPDLDGLPSLLRRPPLTFQWPPVVGAVEYRTQIFADAALPRLLAAQRVESPKVAWSGLAEGRYVLRVRGIDELGLEGLDASHPFAFDPGPKAPLPLTPRDGATFRTPTPQFRWTLAPGATSIRLQLARDRAFDETVFDVAGHTEASLQMREPLSPGLYYWRVASQSASDGEGPWSARRSFRVLARPPEPRLRSSRVKRQRISVTWVPAAHAVRYRCQLARSAAFTDLIEELMVTEPKCQSGPLGPGRYFIRAQGVSIEGIAGPFSPAQSLEVPPAVYFPLLLLGLLLLLLLLL